MMVRLNTTRKMRRGFSRRIAGLSINVWLLLFIPVSIAFIVGGYGPTIVDYDFNIYSAIGWALFIFIVDLSILRTETRGLVSVLRMILLILSMTITATVGDLIFFDDDIVKHKKEILQDSYNLALDKFGDKSDEFYAAMKEEQKTGEGTLFHQLEDRYNAHIANPPTKEDDEGGPLTNVIALHKLLSTNVAAFWVFMGQMIMFGLLEAMPFMLKNAKLKSQYRS